MFYYFYCILDTSSPIITSKIEREEPEKIKKWREEQKTRLEEKGNIIFGKDSCYMHYLLIVNYVNLIALILKTFL